tara:strand:- start:78 stop:812 length:735 start_codon:yes stop_codon:yes gene_type:complete
MNIGWTIVDSESDLLYEEPEKIYKKVIDEYSAGSDIQNCLGVNDLWKNVFSLKLPFDLKISYDDTLQKVIIDEEYTSINTDKLISLIINDVNAYTKHPIIQIELKQIFSSDKQCLLTVMPPIFELDSNPMWQYIRLFSGTMNIYDWHRNVNFSFEWLDTSKPIIIKKDTPISYVKFNSKKLDDTFNIKRLEFDGDIKKSYNRCIGSRNIIKRGTRFLLKRNKELRPKHIVGSECPFSKIKFWKK